MSDEITLTKDEADQTSTFLWRLLAHLDNSCEYTSSEEMSKIEALANILEGRRPCPECEEYPCICDEEEKVDVLMRQFGYKG